MQALCTGFPPFTKVVFHSYDTSPLKKFLVTLKENCCYEQYLKIIVKKFYCIETLCTTVLTNASYSTKPQSCCLLPFYPPGHPPARLVPQYSQQHTATESRPLHLSMWNFHTRFHKEVRNKMADSKYQKQFFVLYKNRAEKSLPQIFRSRLFSQLLQAIQTR